MIRIKNTADDRRKVLLHRTSTRFELEPVLGATRIRLGKHVDITDDHYDRVKWMVDAWVKNGMVEVTRLDEGLAEPKELELPASMIVNVSGMDKLEFSDDQTVRESVEVALEDKDLGEITVLTPEPPKKGRPKKY
jgi:hypothetical protein